MNADEAIQQIENLILVPRIAGESVKLHPAVVMVVLVVGNVPALPDDLQADLTRQLGTMRYVDRDTLASRCDLASEMYVSSAPTTATGITGDWVLRAILMKPPLPKRASL